MSILCKPQCPLCTISDRLKVRRGFCMLNAYRSPMLIRKNPRLVLNLLMLISVCIHWVWFHMHMFLHYSARARLNVSFTESRARACYDLVCTLRYDSDSLSPGPGHVLVRASLHYSPSPSYLRAGTRYLYVIMMWCYGDGGQDGTWLLFTETRSRGPGHVMYAWLWYAWLYLPSPLIKGRDTLCTYDSDMHAFIHRVPK